MKFCLNTVLVLFFVFYTPFLLPAEPYVTVYGAIRGTAFYDTRDNWYGRRGYFSYLPAPENFSTPYDIDGNHVGQVDVAKKSSLGVSFIESKLAVKIGGENIGRFETAALIDGDFFGPSVADGLADLVQGFRLRLAYCTLTDDCHKILFGQQVHTLFIPDCFPQVVCYDDGLPFECEAICPQIRYSFVMPHWQCTCMLSSHREFEFWGPPGDDPRDIFDNFSWAPWFIRWSSMPALTMLTQYKNGNFIMGFGGEIKRVIPRIKTLFSLNNQSGEHIYQVPTRAGVMGIVAEVYAAWKDENGGVRTKVLYGQNCVEHGMLPGYAVTSRDAYNREEYTPLATVSAWLDADVHVCKEYTLGIFFGALKHMHPRTRLYEDSDGHLTVYEFHRKVYDLNGNVKEFFPCAAFRASPRICWRRNQLEVCGEIEVNEATFGPYTPCGIDPQSTTTNVRASLYVAYYF